MRQALTLLRLEHVPRLAHSGESVYLCRQVPLRLASDLAIYPFPTVGVPLTSCCAVRLHRGMATSQWRFEPIVWGSPSEHLDERVRRDRGGICFDVWSVADGKCVAGLALDWLMEPDHLGATIEFTLNAFANDRHAFPAWVASGRLVPQPGGVVMSQLSIGADAPGVPGASLLTAEDYKLNPGDPVPDKWIPDGGITSGLLRKIPLGIVFAGLQALQGADDSPEMVDFLQHISVDYPDMSRAIAESGLPPGEPAETQSAKRGGRPGLPDEHLREVALAYLEMGGQRGVHALLSKRFNKTPDAMKELIRSARRAGWLAPGQAGRRGAYPGPRLLEERVSSPAPGNLAQNSGEEMPEEE